MMKREKEPSRRITLPNDVTVYKKSEEEDMFAIKPKHDKGQPGHNATDHHQQASAREEGKKKSKYLPLYSEEGQRQAVVKLKGRHNCECQATKHSLVNNCLSCGRIVCDQEGAGPCMYCGNLVCTNEEWDVISRGSKKGEKLRNFLQNVGGGGTIVVNESDSNARQLSEKAVQYKDRLLEYDRNSVQRTQVIDDESDYFSLDSIWLSPEQRSKLEKREQELRDRQASSRRDRKVTLDFAGRRIIEEPDSSFSLLYRGDDAVIPEVHQYSAATSAYSKSLVNPTITQVPPTYIKPENSYSDAVNGQRSGEVANQDDKRVNARLQDRELKEMSDDGMCMSMHQPWASLLVARIKRHEGRDWYTAHRGRLWIAATAKVTPREEIEQNVQLYRDISADEKLSFPHDYPVSCLLGCVDVVDCLDQDTYRQQYPDGESMSQYVFICRNPLTLTVKFPIKGKHKIYKLDNHIHQAVKKCTQPLKR